MKLSIKPLKELVEGELIVYEHYPPNDDISEAHKEACEASLKKVEKYIGNRLE